MLYTSIIKLIKSTKLRSRYLAIIIKSTDTITTPVIIIMDFETSST
jgi:hypothetical protein